MTFFICPICRSALERKENSYKCERGHSFDIARSGYLNLLTPSQMNSKAPGDNKEMVRARKLFLSKGYYEPLKLALSKKASKVAGANPVYFDAGCGTGYYTEGVVSSLENATLLGVDVSKFATDASAKDIKEGFFAVSSVYDLPLSDECIDLVTCVFSPMADAEYRRIMKKGAHLLYVVPAPKHLFEMKEVLYDEPYLNEEIFPRYEGFEEKGRERVSFKRTLTEREDVENLFKMTPYAYRTSREGVEKLSSLESLEVTLDFYIIDLVKI